MKLLPLALVLIAATPAFAEDRAKAQQYFRTAEKAFRAQKFATAAESFERAYAELPLPEIAFSAAQAYRRQYYVDQKPALAKRAVELYRIYLDKVKEGGRVADASDALAEMQKFAGEATGPVETQMAQKQRVTQIAIGATVEGEQQQTEMTELSAMPADDKLGARATLDGKPVKLYDWIEVTPTEHVIEVVAEGYFPGTLKKRVVEGDSDAIEVVLKPRPATIVIATEAGASVSIDGRATGTRATVPAGRHLVTVTRRGREPVQREIVVGRGQEQRVPIELTYTTKRRAVPWVLAGSGTAAVLAGITTIVAVRADGRMEDLAAKRDREGITAAEYADYQRANQQRDRFRDATWVLGGATVATAAIAGALWLFDRPTASDRAVIPLASPTTAGAMLQFRY